MKTFAFIGLLGALSSVDDYLPTEITVPEGEGVMMHLYSESFKPFLENSKLKGEYSVSVILDGEVIAPYSNFLPGNFLSYSVFEDEYDNDAGSAIKIDKLQDSFFVDTYFEELEKDSVGNRKIKGKFVKVSFTANRRINDFNINSYLVDSTGRYTDSEYKKILLRRPKGEVKWQYPNDFISTSSISFDKDTDYDLYVFPHSRTPNGDASELERYFTFIEQGYFEDTWEPSVFEHYSGKKILLLSSFNPKLGAVVSKRQLLDGNALISQQLDGIKSTPVFKINKDIIAAGEKQKVNFRISNKSSNKEYLSKEVLVNVVDSECESKNILNAFYVPAQERYNNIPPILEGQQYLRPSSNLGFSVTLPLNWLPDLEYITAGENKGYRVVGNSVYLDFVKDHGTSYDPDRKYLDINLDFKTLNVKYKVSGCQEKEVTVPFRSVEFSGVPVIKDPIGISSDEVLSVELGKSINIPLEISDSDANLAVVTAELRDPSADGDASFAPRLVSWYRLGPDVYDSGGRNTHVFSNYTIQLPVIPFDPAMKPFEEFMFSSELGEFMLSSESGELTVPEPGEYDLYIVAQDTDGNAGVMVKNINILANPNIKKVEPKMLTNYSGQLPLDGYLAIEFTVSDDQAGAYMVWYLIENHESGLGISSVAVFKEESGEHIYRDSLETCSYPGEYYLEPGNYIIKISTDAELSYQPASELSDQTFDFAISNEPNFSFEGSENSPSNYCGQLFFEEFF
jgi:hypothetical protein